MRTRFLTAVGMAVAGLLTVAPAARADDPTYRFSGTVEHVDPANNQITLDGSRDALKVTDQTQIFRDGKLAALSDVSEGDEVRAVYTESADSGDMVKVSRLLVVTPQFTDEG